MTALNILRLDAQCGEICCFFAPKFC